MMTLKQFLGDESGAVTVDWVVLTGATVALAMAGASFLKDPVTNLVTEIAGEMNEFNAELTAND